MSDLTSLPVGLYPHHREMLHRIRTADPTLKNDTAVVRAALEEMDRRLAFEASERAAEEPTKGAPVSTEHVASVDGGRLSAALQRAGWTRGDLARHLGIDKSSVRNVEIGRAPLAECCGGVVLTWVESQERQAAK